MSVEPQRDAAPAKAKKKKKSLVPPDELERGSTSKPRKPAATVLDEAPAKKPKKALSVASELRKLQKAEAAGKKKRKLAETAAAAGGGEWKAKATEDGERKKKKKKRAEAGADDAKPARSSDGAGDAAGDGAGDGEDAKPSGRERVHCTVFVGQLPMQARPPPAQQWPDERGASDAPSPTG